MPFEVLPGRSYVETLTQQGAALMKDWLGNTILSIAGGVVIILLMMLNSYIQRIARKEEEQRLELLRSERLKQERLAASQSRRPDDI
jgi:uncharacterized membrane protein